MCRKRLNIYQRLNDLNPRFMNNIFKLKINGRKFHDKCKLVLDIPKWNQNALGYKNIIVLGPKIWSNLPYQVKSSENLDTFKHLLKKWNKKSCKCNSCKK